jgi:RNA polymerase sigma factor (sigma-70 family)
VTTDDSIPTRASLLERLKRGEDQESWREFFDTYRRLIHGVARKAGLTETEAEEVVQDTVISVSRNLADFTYDPAVCSFRTWMLRLTRWRIIDQVRKRMPVGVQASACPPAPYQGTLKRGLQPDETARTATIERIPEPTESGLESLWNEEWESAVLEAALQRVKAQVSPEQFQMFDLYALKQLPVRQVASILGVSVPRIYLAKHRVASLLRSEVKHLRAKLV